MAARAAQHFKSPMTVLQPRHILWTCSSWDLRYYLLVIFAEKQTQLSMVLTRLM